WLDEENHRRALRSILMRSVLCGAVCGLRRVTSRSSTAYARSVRDAAQASLTHSPLVDHTPPSGRACEISRLAVSGPLRRLLPFRSFGSLTADRTDSGTRLRFCELLRANTGRESTATSPTLSSRFHLRTASRQTRGSLGSVRRNSLPVCLRQTDRSHRLRRGSAVLSSSSLLGSSSRAASLRETQLDLRSQPQDVRSDR